jgi:hypothetical protein
MEAGKGENEIELILVLQIRCISILEIKVRPAYRRKPVPGEAQHLSGIVEAQDRSSRNELGNFGCDFAVSAPDIEYPFISWIEVPLPTSAGPMSSSYRLWGPICASLTTSAV